MSQTSDCRVAQNRLMSRLRLLRDIILHELPRLLISTIFHKKTVLRISIVSGGAEPGMSCISGLQGGCKHSVDDASTSCVVKVASSGLIAIDIVPFNNTIRGLMKTSTLICTLEHAPFVTLEGFVSRGSIFSGPTFQEVCDLTALKQQ